MCECCVLEEFTALTCNLTFPFSAPGGTRIDDVDKTKVTEHCVFKAEENHTAICSYAQVNNPLYCVQ